MTAGFFIALSPAEKTEAEPHIDFRFKV